MTGSQLADLLFERFVDPRTGLVYGYLVPDRDAALPTPEELAAGVPSPAAWGTGLEDCALNGGLLLAALSDLDHPRAGAVFAALTRLSTVGEPGTLPRGLLTDGLSRPQNTSTDQLGLVLYGLWCFGRRPSATAAERAAAANLVTALLDRITAAGNRFLNEDGTPAFGGEALATLAFGQAARWLALHAAAADLTGDPARWARYAALVAEADGVRLTRLLDPSADPLPPGWGFYAPEQVQTQLAILAAADPARRARYRAAQVDLADRLLRAAFPSVGHEPRWTAPTLELLGDSAHLPSPFAWRRHRPELLRLPEDLGWRTDYLAHRRAQPDQPGALAFVTGWMGRRPAFCHERNTVRFPLTAFHVALLGGSPEARQRVAAEATELLHTVDFTACRWADTLVEAVAVSALLEALPGQPRATT